MKHLEPESSKILGRPLEPNPRVFPSLNDLPLDLVEEARRLAGILKHAFLMRHLSPDDFLHLGGFIEDVVDGGEHPQQWRRGAALTPFFTLEELVARDTRSIVGVLGPRADEDWHRVPLELLTWAHQEGFAGVPAILRPEVGYRWQSPANVRSFALRGGGPFEPVKDIDVAVRRFVASRLAYSIPNLSAMVTASPEEVLSHAFPHVACISEDARLAMEALLAEVRLLGENPDEIPGFRGADDWYKGRLPA